MTRSRSRFSRPFLLSTLNTSIALIMSIGLVACGGGSESSVVSQKPAPSPTPSIDPMIADFGEYTLKGDIGKSVKVGEPIGLLAVQDQSKVADSYEWQVISDNADQVLISSRHQPASSFKFLKPGEYTIRFSAKKRDSYYQLTPVDTIIYQVTVVEDEAVAALKNDRSARSGATISLYFDVNTPITSDDWEIRQIQGPQSWITYSQKQGSDATVAQVVLPNTTTDQVLAFEASLKSDPSVKDTAYVLLQPIDGSTSPYFCESPTGGAYCLSTTALDHHYAYKPQSPVADMIAECVMSYKINENRVCNLAYLPFIGQVTNEPTIEDIMDRVVVSHDWMGRNFEQFLRHFDDHNDFKRLLRSTTAIVISDNIKPSFYWGGSGTMYLSADYLWMTPDQRDTLTASEDFRMGYTRPFNYLFDFDYEKDKQSVMFNKDYYPARAQSKGRSLETIALPLASLLYHELAHANDFFSQQQLKSTDNYSVAQLAELAPYELVSDPTVSKQLTSSYPLMDDRLSGLAQVWYGGQSPTATQVGYSGQMVADAYFADRATDDYSFYSSAEDVAMLFEEAMMLTRFGVNRYTMVMDTSQGIPTVIRGQKNRIADPRISDRASFVVSKLLPEASLEVSRALSEVEPKELCVGTTYFEYYNTDCNQLDANIPLANKYRRLIQYRKLDESGRPIGAPRHQTPQVLLPPDPRVMP